MKRSLFHSKLNITSIISTTMIRLVILLFCIVAATTVYAKEDPAITQGLKLRYDYVSFVPRDKISNFSYYRIINKSLYGACDTLGREIVPPMYDFVHGAFNYFISDSDDETSTIITQDGTKLLSENRNLHFATYYKDYIICLSDGIVYYDEKKDTFKIKKNGKWGVFSINDNSFTVPLKYDYISGYGEGLFKFCEGGKIENLDDGPKDGKWGFINDKGEIIIDPIYDNVTKFEDGYAQVTKGNKLTLIPNPLNSGNQMTQKINHRVAPVANFTNDNLFVLIIGNSDYPFDIESTSSYADGDMFYKYCEKTLGCPEKNIQYLNNATYANILNAFSHLREVADVYDGEAKVIIYYSGLGATESEGRYLLPSDVEFTNIPSTSISLNTISHLFNSIKTVYSIAIIDAPFDGMDKKSATYLSHRGVMIKEPESMALRNNSFILMGAGQNGRAYNKKEEDVSLLTDAILSSMDRTMNKKSITAFIDKAVKMVQHTSIGLGDKVQSPQLFKSDGFNKSVNTITF